MLLRTMLALLALASSPVPGAASSLAAAPIWRSQCEAQGFQPGALPCGTCRVLGRALGAAHASAQACRACCSASLDIGGRQFDAVSVRLCRLQVGSAGVSEWLEKREGAWAERGVMVEDVCAYGEPPAVVLRNDGDEAEAAAAAAAEAAEGGEAAAAAGEKRKAAKKKSRLPEAPAPAVGVVVPVGSWKVEHIDQFIEAALKKD